MAPDTPARRRPGRPAGGSDARERILASAREMFADKGIDRTSIRGVAAAAGVDPALVHHYYGSKERLFAAAIQIPVNPMDVLIPMRTAPVEELGLTLPSVLLKLWDEQPGFVAALRSLISGSDLTFARNYLQEIVTEAVGSRVDNPRGTGRIRAQYVVSQLMGVVIARHIVRIEPFASLPSEQIAETIAPNLQRYLTGDLPEGLTP